MSIFPFQDESQLIQEELNTSCECLHTDPSIRKLDNKQDHDYKHTQHIEWLREIRLNLLPLLVSCAIFILLIRIVFLVHDAENLIKFLQIIVSLFGATASGYAYAQIRIPQSNLSKPDSFQQKTPES